VRKIGIKLNIAIRGGQIPLLCGLGKYWPSPAGS
jgi:hypothetical protein